MRASLRCGNVIYDGTQRFPELSTNTRVWLCMIPHHVFPRHPGFAHMRFADRVHIALPLRSPRGFVVCVCGCAGDGTLPKSTQMVRRLHRSIGIDILQHQRPNANSGRRRRGALLRGLLVGCDAPEQGLGTDRGAAFAACRTRWKIHQTGCYARRYGQQCG